MSTNILVHIHTVYTEKYISRAYLLTASDTEHIYSLPQIQLGCASAQSHNNHQCSAHHSHKQPMRTCGHQDVWWVLARQLSEKGTDVQDKEMCCLNENCTSNKQTMQIQGMKVNWFWCIHCKSHKFSKIFQSDKLSLRMGKSHIVNFPKLVFGGTRCWLLQQKEWKEPLEKIPFTDQDRKNSVSHMFIDVPLCETLSATSNYQNFIVASWNYKKTSS